MFALIVSAIIIVPTLRDGSAGVITAPGTDDGTDSGSTGNNDRPNIPIVNVQVPSPAPQYYGSESSISTDQTASSIHPCGISVTARFIEALPDTYTFFDDWKQTEFRLIKMKTISLLAGTKMTDEFYFIVPVGYMTDFSLYDTFVISHMGQFGYDFSVLYNVTQRCAETLDIVIFGSSVIQYHSLGTNVTAFDKNDMIDLRLWNSTEAWISMTKSSLDQGKYDSSYTKKQAESEASKWGEIARYVHTLKDLSEDSKALLDILKKLECGVFIPNSTNKLWYFEPDIQLECTRYINGFATNETIEFKGKSTVKHSKAQFSSNDLNALPDLPSAYAALKSAFEDGKIIPPHIQNYSELRNTSNGIFGWYAKTENSVIGIIRVTWCFISENYNFYFDDLYYVIEYGADECKAIDRDSLIEKLGEYEKTYIYTGKYGEFGKEIYFYYDPRFA